MNKYKQHIVIVLCLIFAFPQINNAVHYFWLEHHFSHSAEKGTVFGEKHNSHNCEQHIFKVPSLTTISFFSFTPFVPGFYIERPYKYIKTYRLQTVTLCFLRGPPSI